MGLVQLFRDLPCPDVLARQLLARVLEDFHETGHHYLLHLIVTREMTRRVGTKEEVEALDADIREYALHEQIPNRWQLNFLFSHAGYDTYGEGILPFWAAALIHICVLEQHWESILLGRRSQNPYLLVGSHSDEEVWSTSWLDDFRPTWATELEDVYPQLGPWFH